MASVTVDIQAKVVGYEASLKAMKDAFSKIDPGTEIGKNLEKAIKYAENQLKGLNKNLTPRATSDTQIDAIIEKTNRAGEAIQEVTNLMQKVSIGDIDFSKFDSGIGKLMESLSTLEDELGTRVSEGFKKAIEGSTELNEAFKNFNIDIKDKSAGEIFEEVSEKAKQAAADTEAAKKVLDVAQKDLNSKQAKLSQLESNPIYNKDVLKQDLNNLASEYIKTFDSIKETIRGNLSNLLGGNEVKADKMMEAFTQGLSPQTLKDHLMKLKDSLQKELKEGNSAKEIYSALLGGDVGSSGNAQAVTTKLLAELNKVLPTIKEEFQTKFQDIISSLTTKEAGNISVLMDEGDLEGALKTMLKAIERAYSTAVGEVKKGQQAVADAMKEKASAQEKYDTAADNQKNIGDVVAQLTSQLKDVQEQNKDLQNQINELKSQISEKKSSAALKIRSDARENGLNVESWKIGQEEAKKYQAELDRVQAKEKLVGKIEGVVQRWFSIYAAVRMVGNAIRSVISTVKELDKTITEIAIVTNMTQDELWDQMKSYTDMARQYAASISGVYQVSQLYYQQGLQTADVMALTEETLKMARISGLGYAEATDYMTNAVRSFKMEMTDAQRVVDVYSEIAASSATSTSELASAMSKTASSAEAVGSSFENTTAMMAVMIEATRESAENIGSAMKSIISRYGEMTANPAKLMDSEGQEMSLNKVDKALKSVGITIQDSNHQFRDFDEVITELAGKWNTIDTNTQRYIATVMAGNRQQSRFLALVSNGERLAELSEKAANSEDAATLQVLKTMDSIEAKTQQFKTSLQSLYTDTGVQNFFKGILDLGNNVVKTFTEMPRIFNLPIPAIVKFGTQFYTLSSVVLNAFSMIKVGLNKKMSENSLLLKAAQQEELTQAEQTALNRILTEQRKQKGILDAQRQGEQARLADQKAHDQAQIDEADAAAQRQVDAANKALAQRKHAQIGGMVASTAGLALSTVAGNMDINQNRGLKAGLTGASAALQGLGTGLMLGGAPGVIMGAFSSLPGIIEAIGIASESTEEKISRLGSAITETGNKKIQSKDELKTLTDYQKKYSELINTRNKDEESREEWIKLNNEIAANYPELIEFMSAEGNYIVNMAEGYKELRNAKIEAYKNDFLDNLSAEFAGLNDINYILTQIYNHKGLNGSHGIGTYIFPHMTSNTDQIVSILSENLNNLFKMKESYNNALTIGTVDEIFQGHTNRDYEAWDIFKQDFKLTDEGKDRYSDIMMEFTLAAKDNLDLANAKNLVSKKFQNQPELLDAIENFDTGIYGIIRDGIQALNYQNTLIENKEKTAFQEWIKIISNQYDLNINDLQTNFGVEDLQKTWKEYQAKNNTKLHTKEIRNGKEIEITTGVLFQDFLEQYQYDWLYGIINQTKNFENEALNSLYKTSHKKTRGNYETELRKISGISEEDIQQLLNYYDNETSLIFSNFVNGFKDLKINIHDKNLQSKIDDWAEKLQYHFGPEYLDNVLAQYSKILKNDSLSDAQKNTQFDALLGIYDSILQNPQSETILEAMKTADLTSLSGVYDFITGLEEIGINLDGTALKDKILNFGNNLVVNLTTEFETFSQSIISNSEDFGKVLSKASKGMELKEASEIAAKLKISLTDFRFEDGKYFYDDVQKIQEAYLSINKNLKQSLDNEVSELTKKTSQLKFNILANSNNEDWLSDSIEVRQNFVQTTFGVDEQMAAKIVSNYDKYIDAWKQSGQKISLGEYISQDITKSQENLESAIDDYTDYQINTFLLAQGRLAEFIANQPNLTPEKVGAISDAYNSRDLDKLLQLLPEYSTVLINTFENLSNNIYNNIISGITSGSYIKSTDSTDSFYKKFIYGENAILKQVADNTYKFIGDSYQVLIDEINSDKELTNEQQNTLLKSLHEEQYKNNIYTAFSEIVDSYDNFSYEAGQKLANALGTTVENLIAKNQIAIDQAGNLSVDENFIGWYIQELGKNLDDTNRELYNNLKADFEKHNRELSDTSVLSNIIQNRSKLTEEDIKALANQFEDNYGNIANLLQKNDDGTYTASITQLDSWIKAKKIEVNNSIKELIANEIDGVVSSITGLAGSQSKGYTNIADMQKYISQLSELGVTGVDLDFKNIFSDFDETLHAYRLSTNGLIAQIRGMKSQLNDLTGEQKEVAQRLIDDTTRQFADSIDVDSLISSLGTNQADLSRENFIKAVNDYNAVLVAMADVGEEVSALDSEALADNIAKGGIEAIAALEEIAKAQGKQITAEQAEVAWRSKINSYVNAIDQLVAKPGEIVDKTTADIINEADGIALEIGSSGTYLVQTAANLYKAYKDLLDQMSKSGEATLADLNKVAGLALDNKDGQQVAIDALGDAANLTYSRLGEIFTSANKLMTEELVQDWTDKGLIKTFGGNKIQITDFAKFANLMGFDTGSPEYVSAFKTYNNSLIEMNRQAERNILEEAQNVASAKGGDWIDLTQLTNVLNEQFSKYGLGLQKALESRGETPFDNLQNQLIRYGAYIDKGILKIADNADVLGIIKTIEQTVQKSGGLLSNELAELADAVAKAISDYANLINTGIKGNLDKQQANQLQDFANNYGVGKLDFTKTVNGLKLSQESATELYNVISKIDSLQGQVVFSELRSSLEATNEGLANISNTSATISRTQQKMVENQKLINDLEKVKTYSRDPEKNQKNIDRLKAENRELQTQLDLYNKIAIAQSSDPESFDFMNRKMPDTFNGPMNYWNSIGEAYGSMRDAASSGKMEMQDFYNIVTEMSNLAQMSGQTIDFMGYSINGDLTNASKLIQSGFNSLSNVDGKGVKVDMGKLAANLQTGAKDMGKGFDTAIQSMAKSQVAMLDGMIRLLETIVAMENLGDIDVNGDNTIDVGELFDTITLENGDKITQYSQEAQKVMTDIQTAASKNPEIQTAFESFFLGGHNLWEYITNEGKIIDKLSTEGQQALATVFTKMMQLSQSGEFDLDNIQESVMNLVNQSGLSDLLNGSFYDEEANLSYIMVPNLTATVDWSQWDKTKLTELSDEIDGVDAKTQEEAQALLDKYAANPADLTPGELEYVLKLTNTIQVERDENGNETGNYLFNGVSVPKDDLARVIAQTDQIGVDMKSLEYDLDTGSITFNQTLSSSINVKVVTNKDGSKTYTMPDGSEISGDKNSTPEDAYREWYHAHREFYGTDEHGRPIFETEEEFNAKVNAKFNNQISITGNADTDETRAQIETFLSKGRSAIQKIIDKTPEGEPIQIPFADATFTFPPGTSIETITSSLMSQLGLDKNLMDSISNAITNAFTSSNNGETNVIQKAISDAIQSAFGIGQQTGTNSKSGGIPISGVTLSPQGLIIDLSNAGEPILKGTEEESLQEIPIGAVTLKPTSINVSTENLDVSGETTEDSSSTITKKIEIDDKQAKTDIETLNTSAAKSEEKIVSTNTTDADNDIATLNTEANLDASKIVSVSVTLPEIWDKLGDPISKIVKVSAQKAGTWPVGIWPEVTGNVALSTGNLQGKAYSAGNTLMGELGPELVVSHGRYFVVGQNGPEMVNLAEDAIVFNHLQTEQLLRHGKASGHAKPVTNERNATSLATGNAGPAMASASAALDALKQLRSMWQSLLNASLKDLGGLAGGSGGGGGGGGGNDDATKGVLGNIERWYNYLQDIAQTQVKINKLTKEYTLLEKQGASSKARLKNLQDEYDLLKRNKETRDDLVEQQTKYRTTLLKKVNKGKGAYGLLSAFYSGDLETGTLTLKNDKAFQEFVKKRGTGKTLKGKGITVNKRSFYTEEEAEAYNKKNEKAIQKGKVEAVKAGDVKGSKSVKFKATGGLELFNKLQKKDQYGNLVYSAEDQLKILKDLGFGEYLKKDASGNKLKTAEEKVEYFFSQIDSSKGEIEALTDSINDQEQAVLDDVISMQEINDQIRELIQPIEGVTEGLEKWYNQLKQIEAIQNKINILDKNNNLLQKDQIANGREIYQNRKDALKNLEEEQNKTTALIQQQEKERASLVDKYKDLPIEYDATTGVATFSDKVYNQDVQTKYSKVKTFTDTKTNQTYQLDTNGNYVDDKGVLRNSKTGKKVKEGSFEELATEQATETFNLQGMTMPEILEYITSQDETGKVRANSDQQYQILKALGYEKFLQYDENGKQIYDNFGEMTKEERQAAVTAGIQRMQGAADEINDLTKSINDNIGTNLDLAAQELDIQQDIIDNSIEVQNLLKDAVVQEHQDIIDEKKEVKDAIKKAADKTVAGLKDSLDRERKVYDSGQNEQELTLLQMRLATLRTSGGSSAEISDLEKQIRQKREDIYFDERELGIENLEEAANKQNEALEEQIDIMQTALDYQVKFGTIWDEVNEKLATGNESSLADYITKNTPGFLAQSNEDQAKNLKAVLESVQFFKAGVEDKAAVEGNGNEQPVVPEEPAAPEEPPVVPEEPTEPSPEPPSLDQQNEEASTLEEQLEEVALTIEQRDAKLNRAINNLLKKTSLNDAQKQNITGEMLTAGQMAYEASIGSNDERFASAKSEMRNILDRLLREQEKKQLRKESKRHFSTGGDIDFTGPAWVDGTKSKPEHIFNYEQMQEMKKMFFENLAITQVGILGLSSIADNLPNTNAYNNINNEDNGVTIDKLDFHMEVQEISNGYDARDAGREVMNEILNIARKTGSRSISRR